MFSCLIFKVIIYFQLNQEFSQLNFFSLNICSSSFLHLLKMTERTNAFSNRYDILLFSNLLHLPQITQYDFFIFLVIENILVLLYHCSHNHLKKINLHNEANFYL